MKSKRLESAYLRLWQAVENGTVDQDFTELREEAREHLSRASDNILMQRAGALLLEVHGEWNEVAERLPDDITADELFEAFKRYITRP